MSRDQFQGPQRIVCLTEKTTETLYLLGEEARIVGISGFTVRPPQARKEKPKVSAFTSAKTDLQADIAAALIRHRLQVHVFNHRSVEGILDMIGLLGAMVGIAAKVEALVEQYRTNLEAVRREAGCLPRRPRVYFEERPLMSEIRWVSELIGIAGGEECFPELTTAASIKNRIIADPNEVVRRAPDIIIGSWCGKRFRPERVMARAGWDAIPAVGTGHVYEIKSSDILQPGPAALSDGLAQIRRIIRHWPEETTQ